MFIENGDGTYTSGPADIICIFRLPDLRYHAALLEEKPMPGPIKPLNDLDIIRFKSKMHHTQGAETLKGAQEHVFQLHQHIKLDDTNVVADIAFDIGDPVCVLPVRNWIKENMSLKEAMGLPIAA